MLGLLIMISKRRCDTSLKAWGILRRGFGDTFKRVNTFTRPLKEGENIGSSRT